MNNNHVQALQERLHKLFETKAEEFTRYSEENPSTASVTKQIAGMYEDLALVMKS